MLNSLPGTRPDGVRCGSFWKAGLVTDWDLARCSGYDVEVGDGEPEGRVDADGEPQCRGGPARVAGALCLPVCGYRAAVDVYRRPGSGQVLMMARVPVTP